MTCCTKHVGPCEQELAMRTTHPQRDLLRQELLGHWPELAEDLTPQLLIDVELGLSISERLMPEAEANALWVLLTGYRSTILPTSRWGRDDQQVAANARFLLGTYASSYAWTTALDAYCLIPERLRGYDVSIDRMTYTRREPGVAANRWNT